MTAEPGEPDERDASSLALLKLLHSLQETPDLPIPAFAIADLQSRIERQIAKRRGIRFSPEDVDIMSAIGVGELIALASARKMKLLAIDRIYDRAGLPPPSKATKQTGEEPAEKQGYSGHRPAQAVADKPYTIARLAERWRVSAENVRARIKSGELQAFMIGPRTYRIRPEVVREYEERLMR